MKLDEIYRPIEIDLDRVHQLLKSEMEQVIIQERGGQSDSRESKYDKFTAKAINYLLTQPGKHLRPALVLFAARAVGAEIHESLIRMAASIELIHSASLVHDDIIDEAEKRRNLLSVHKKYGVKIAILIGDVLFAQSFDIVAGLPGVDSDTKVRLYEILTSLTRRMCYGEIFEQQILDGGEPVGREDYLRVLEFKTALLMSAACRCGAIIGGADKDKEEALASYGLNYGYAYQLVDDLRDGDSIYSGDLNLMDLAGEYVKAANTDLTILQQPGITKTMSAFAEFILSAG
jgi:octaprenyl-diphosphate synthase